MNTQELKEFLDKDVAYELRCLLGAATVWQANRDHEKGFEVVVALDSALVHARCLFNFFTGNGHNDVSVQEFGHGPYPSALYEEWREPLNRHVLHISRGRLTPTNVGNNLHLNEMVIEFVNEMLDLWTRFEKDSADPRVAEIRTKAVDDSRKDAAAKLTAPMW